MRGAYGEKEKHAECFSARSSNRDPCNIHLNIASGRHLFNADSKVAAVTAGACYNKYDKLPGFPQIKS